MLSVLNNIVLIKAGGYRFLMKAILPLEYNYDMIIIANNTNINLYLNNCNYFTVVTECLDTRLHGIGYYIHTVYIISIDIITSCIIVHNIFQYSFLITISISYK